MAGCDIYSWFFFSLGMNFKDGEDKADKTKPHGEEFKLPDSHQYLCLSLERDETQQSRMLIFTLLYFE
jgi:hypothetical protein